MRNRGASSTTWRRLAKPAPASSTARLTVGPEARDRAADRRVVVDLGVLGDLEHDPARPIGEERGQLARVEDHVRRDVQAEPGVRRQRLGGVERGRETGDLELEPETHRVRVGDHPIGRRAVGEAGERLVADGLARGERHDRLEDRAETALREDALDALPNPSVPVTPFELAAEQRTRRRRELADGREVVDQMAGVRLVARPGGDEAEQALAVADRRIGDRPDAELGHRLAVRARPRVAAATPRPTDPAPPARTGTLARAAGNGRPGATGRPSGPAHRERDGPLRVEEVEDRRDVDAGQAEELVADVGGRLLGARAGLEAGQGRGHLGTFAELARRGRTPPPAGP